MSKHVLLATAGWTLEVNPFGFLEIRHEEVLLASSADMSPGMLRYSASCDTLTIRWKVWGMADSIPLVTYDGQGTSPAFTVQGLIGVPVSELKNALG